MYDLARPAPAAERVVDGSPDGVRGGDADQLLGGRVQVDDDARGSTTTTPSSRLASTSVQSGRGGPVGTGRVLLRALN